MDRHHRHSIRLKGFDYASDGSYFVTIVTHYREPIFGKIIGDEMALNDFGKIVEFTWKDLPNHNPNIGLDEFVIMPNHIHFIVNIFDPVGAGSKPAHDSKPTDDSKPAQTGAGYEPAPTNEPAPTKRIPLSEIVRQFKTFSARRINELRGTSGLPVWQRNYYEHIIGNDREYEQIASYIANNPYNWLADEERIPL